ncbi:MAG: LysR family transcriptional regulator [Anaerolineae bacterium]|nr:LysR family transcriptional regulator [Anaerolineae bacterium]
MAEYKFGSLLDLNELVVFLVAAETENFSETGRLLDMSQPAVSGHIQGLEQRFNTRLFDRTGRNIQLNDVGAAFVPVVRNLLKEARQAEEFLAAQHGSVMGSVTIGCSTAIGKYILPNLMSRFLECNPDVRLICQMGPRGQAVDRLAEGEIDLAVTSLRIPRRSIEYRHFADDRLVLVVPPEHAWARAGQLTPDDLVEYPLILRETSSGTAITLNRELAKHDMSLDVLHSRLTLGNSEAIVQSVIAGVGPAFVSHLIARDAVQKGLVVCVPVAGLDLVQRLYMARNTGFRATEAQRAFWDFTFSPDNAALRLL